MGGDRGVAFIVDFGLPTVDVLEVAATFMGAVRVRGPASTAPAASADPAIGSGWGMGIGGPKALGSGTGGTMASEAEASTALGTSFTMGGDGKSGADDANDARDHDEDGTMGGGRSLEARVLGGHSLLSLTSSFPDSPVVFDVTLVLRGAADGGSFFVCCSKRPIRFATL